MKNQLKIFEHEEFGKVRVVDINGEPWFVGKDVADILGYENGSRDINRHVDAQDRRNYRNGTSEINNRGVTIINESGLYSLILSSKQPQAKAFKRWVTSEILPTIRKYGAYATSDTLDEMLRNPKFAESLMRKLKEERDKNAELMELTEELTPKALCCDIILQSDNLIPVSLIAKDYGYSAVAFNRLLNELCIQFKIGDTWLLYQEYADKGYTQTRTYYLGGKVGAIHTCWTQKGRMFLYETLKSFGIVPMIERRAAAV